MLSEINDADTTYQQIKNRNRYAFQQLRSSPDKDSMDVKQIFTEGGFKIIEEHQLPGRCATYGAIPERLDHKVQKKLRQTYPEGLYEHQAVAINAFLDGKDLCLATSTASGKSLIFMVLAAHQLLANRASRVIAVYPQRALTQDQLGKWKSFLEGLDVSVGLIDGSVQRQERLEILEQSRVVVMTPDVVHSWMMSNLIDTKSKLHQLGVLILDECHLYTEILGTNMAYLLRRMNYATGGDYRIISATATVGKPDEMIRKLTGRSSFKVIRSADDSSPAPEKTLMLAQYDQSNLTRELRDLGLVNKLANHYGGKLLVFVDSRQRVESIAGCLASTQVTENGVLPYRSGYETEDRKDIQTSLATGNLKGVVTTSALEVGVDIGDIDLVVILGYPPSVNSFWQRFGRAGRRANSRCECVVIDTMGIMATVDGGIAKYMEKPPVDSLFYMENRFLRFGNALCAAHELNQLMPNAAQDDEWEIDACFAVLSPGFATEVLNIAMFLKKRAVQENVDRELSRIPSEFRVMLPPDDKPPHLRLSLRQVMEDRFLIRDSNGNPIEELSSSQRFKEAYPGAIWRHRGIAYRITTRNPGLEIPELRAERENGIDQKKTERDAKERIVPIFASTLALKKSSAGYAATCNLKIEERVSGFKQRRVGSRTWENEIQYCQGYPYQNESLARISETTGVVISLPEGVADSWVTRFLVEGFSTISGISLRNIGFGSVTNPQCPFFKHKHKAICIYDDVQGGFHLTEELIHNLEGVAKRAALIAGDSEDENRDAIVRMLKRLERHFACLKRIEIGVGYRNEPTEILRQEDGFRLVVLPGQDVVLHSDPDKRRFQITDVFLTPDGKIKYKTGLKKKVEHENVVIMPGETVLGWFDPNEDEVLDEGVGPNTLSIGTVQVLPPAYEFSLRSPYVEGEQYERMVPMKEFSSEDLVLIRDPRMPGGGIAFGKWFESRRLHQDSEIINCRLRSLSPESPDDIWSGEFSGEERPEFGWWAVQRREVT